jgi:hypothetical protein
VLFIFERIYKTGYLFSLLFRETKLHFIQHKKIRFRIYIGFLFKNLDL